MRVRETLAGVASELKSAGVESARAEAEILLAAVLGLLDEPRHALIQASEGELTTAQARTLAALLLRRISGEPVQYIVRRAWFRDLTLEVGRGVLIPRPETEGLVDEVLSFLARWPAGSTPPLVLDLGTGSGCIALAIAAEFPSACVIATDLSPEALQFARRNLDRTNARFPGVAERVSLAASDGFAAFRAAPRFAVVAANPPYVSRQDAHLLPREVRDHEPAVALFASENGLSALRNIIEQAARLLLPGGLLALEVGESQADNVIARIEPRLEFRPARAVQDLAGRPRVVLAERLA